MSTTPPHPPHMQPPDTTWGTSSSGPGLPYSYGPPPTPSQRPGIDPNGAGPFGTGSDTGTHDRRPPRRGVWVAAAALLAGAIGGVGGAAGYSALSDDSPTQVRDALTAPVVNTGNTTSTSGSQDVESVAAAVLPSVVKISVSSASAAGSGSGIVLTSDGLILTNNHVAEIAAHGGNIAVSLNDGTDAPAHIVGRDPLTDLAVIQAEGVSGLTPATLGSSSNLQVGEQVVAIGSPFGLDSTVTSGIVSALNRPVDASNNASGPSGSDSIFAGIQTDAAINPGNSGGALVNMQGQVIGINSAIYSPTSSSTAEGGSVGLGFAIPIDEARPIAEQLRNGQTATHARLGVTIQDATNSEGLVDGAKVSKVTPGSAAADAGLKTGDVITRIGDQPVTGADSLVALVRTYRPGDEVTLGVDQNGNTETVSVTLGSDATGS